MSRFRHETIIPLYEFILDATDLESAKAYALADQIVRSTVLDDLLTQVWDDAVDEAYERGMIHDPSDNDMKLLNPYRRSRND